MKFKILLINAIRSTTEVEQRHPPLGLGYLASALMKHFGRDFFEFRIIDRAVYTELKRFKPDIVFLSSVTQNYNIARNYAHFLKQQQIPVIVGGIHITMLPSSLSPEFDVGVIGEGEETAVELIEVFLKNKKFSAGDLIKINGIVFRDNDTIRFTQPRPAIPNLDSIAMPAREFLKIDKHTYMFTSRGCPYKCVFCASTRFWNTVRFFSAAYVINEIRELVDKYNVRLISFYDDLFIADRKRLKEISLLIREDKKLHKIRFTCNARANLVNDEVVQLLKHMNVHSINLGLESGCTRTLEYLKPAVTVEQNINAVKTIKRYGLACNGSFIIGCPHETKEDILETYKFVKKTPINLTDIYVLTPYPGTPVWEYAKSRGLVSDDMQWSKLDVNFQNNFNQAIIVSETLNRKEIVRFFKKFYRLRLFKNAMGIAKNPYLMDLPKIVKKLLLERLYGFLQFIRLYN
ncbi:radical SAM protein [Candidatus Peregrinibacteria bacterium]|nr:radical SAM protein [Candidatus Peregrinibacteria bacterium]